MIKLFKYLKPYAFLILAAIALLFGQAMADLALPNYMSEIVNVGIQQGGVENALPVAMRASTIEKMQLVLVPEEKDELLAAYTRVEKGDANATTISEKFPAFANEDIYVLNDLDAADISKLNAISGKALLTVSMIESIMSDPQKAAELGASGMDLSMIPAGMDLFDVLAKMPEGERVRINTAINDRFIGMSESMIEQSVAAPIKAEYDALGMDLGKFQTAYLLRIGGLMLLLSLASVTCTIVVSFLSARTAAGVARDVRRDLFTKVEGFSKAEFEKFSTASLITRSTNDITQIQTVIVMMIRMVFYAPIIGVGAVLQAINTSPSMTWIIALAVAVLLAVIIVVFSVSLPKFKLIQSLIDRLNLVTRESLSGMMVIRAFNTQSFEAQRFDKANQDLTQNMLFVSRIMVILMPFMMLIMNGLSVVIIWVGAHQVANSALQVGDMMAFMQYAIQVVFSFLMLSFMFIILPRASVSAGRVAEVLAVEATILDPKDPNHFGKTTNGLIEFRDVSFRYPNAEEDVLHNLSFTAKPGETTAIIGSTGSGKSTVVNLIPRFFDITNGAILMDGVDIREVKQGELREKIGYVPQKGLLFSGTIESNLRYADENADDAAIKKAIEIAQAADFVYNNENGLQMEISQGGSNVSGGQKQRLAIARALVKKPPVYIFDDCLSALDFKTDSALRRALKKETGESTVIIVTQRVATVKTADQIIVLDNGEIVGIGKHEKLLKTCETYREIAASQLSAEELA